MLEQAVDLVEGDAPLRTKRDLLWNARLLTSLGIRCPALWQVETRVRETRL
jgi:hypothetical protein